MNAMSFTSVQQHATSAERLSATPAMDALYKTQSFSAALKIAAGRDEGIFQFSGIYIPTLILDAATRICYLRADESINASHASETTSVRQLKAAPEWIQRGRMIRLDAILSDQRAAAAAAQQHAAALQTTQELKIQAAHTFLGILRRPLFGSHAH